jgi:hypothetical protein
MLLKVALNTIRLAHTPTPLIPNQPMFIFPDYECFAEKLGPTICPTRVEHADQYTTDVGAKNQCSANVWILYIFVHLFNIYIIMWSFPSNMPNYYPGLRDILPDPKWRVICFSDLGNILACYLDRTTLLSLLYWVSNCPGNMPKYYPGNMPKYYSTKYHYINLHEV